MDKNKANINLIFPKVKYSKYLNFCGIKNDSKLDDKLTENIFIKMIEDFHSGELRFDDFSQIANKLWWNGVIRKDNLKNKELYSILQLGGELGFYVRKSYKKDIGLIFIGFMKDIEDFYKKLTKKG